MIHKYIISACLGFMLGTVATSAMYRPQIRKAEELAEKSVQLSEKWKMIANTWQGVLPDDCSAPNPDIQRLDKRVNAMEEPVE